MQAETKFKNKVLRELKKIPNLWVLKTQMVATRGVPDIIMCANGIFIAWELKVGTNRVTPLQELTLAHIRNANGQGHSVTPRELEVCLEALKVAINTKEGDPNDVYTYYMQHHHPDVERVSANRSQAYDPYGFDANLPDGGGKPPATKPKRKAAVPRPHGGRKSPHNDK